MYKKAAAKRKPRLPNVPIGPYLGPVPKLTSAKMPKTGVNRFHFEDYGNNDDVAFGNGEPLKQGGCAHIGFTDTGGAVVWLAAAGAILRSCYARAGIEAPGSWDGPIVSPGDLEFRFRSMKYQDGSTITDNYTTSGTDLKTQIQGLAWALFDKARQGLYPHEVEMVNSTVGPHFISSAIGESIIDIRIKTNVKFQNTTPADDDPDATGVDMNKNAINANPLQGKIMRFSDIAPKFVNGVLDDISAGEKALSAVISNDISSVVSGNGKMNTSALYDGNGVALARYFEPPKRPLALWRNVTHTANVHLQPGGYRNLAFVFNYHGTLSRLMEHLAVTQNAPGTYDDYRFLPKLGASYMIALEPAIRTTDNERIRVAWNRDIDVKSSFKFHRKPQLPQKNTVPQFDRDWETPSLGRKR